MIDIPDPEYARTADGAHIAFQTVGQGPVDIAWQTDFMGNLDVGWESPMWAAVYEGIASFARLILHDRRGLGLSSRNVTLPNLETRAADLRAVLDAVGSDSPVLAGWGESMAPCVLLAANDPGRLRGLVWEGPRPRTIWAPDYPWGWGKAEVEDELDSFRDWGTIRYGRRWADQIERDTGIRPPEAEIRQIAKESRNACPPDVILELTRIWWETDVRGALPSVHVPTLLVAIGETSPQAEVAAYVASLMPQAEVVILPQLDWPIGAEESRDYARPLIDALRRFVGIEEPRAAVESVLSTVLFTDIVGSTNQQARLGDRQWKKRIERHHSIVRQALLDWRGVENDTAGDGFFATFDGPARAVRCALEITDRVRDLDMEVRAGVHTGECELVDSKHGGIAVAIAARVAALARPSQVLVSQTVKDLVAGSGFTFEPAGEHELKGVPDRWRIYAATNE